MSTALSRFAVPVLLVVAGLIGLGAACDTRGRRPALGPDPNAPNARAATSNPNTPSLRIYYLVDLDGYLEPCGCQSRPLGGIDRVARLMESERSTAPNSVFVAAGDLLYRDPQLDPRMVFQETTKADAMVRILEQLHLTAFAPGPSDFARGPDEWRRAVSAGHAAALAANAQGFAGLSNVVVREVGGTRVGIVGVSDFRESAETAPPAGSPITVDPVAAARTAVAEAKRQGARIVVVLASVPRRAARVIAGDIPGVDFVVAAREESLVAPAPERIGSAYLVTATNQGKSLGIIDLFLRPGGGASLVDASLATATAARARLDTRIAELRIRIAAWEQDATVDRAAVQQQRDRLAGLERERAGMTTVRPPATGSFFNARVQEIDPATPKSRDVRETIASYFRTVNEHNRVAYATLRTPEPAAGQPGYIGIEECRSCHEEAYEVWTRTPHARAYNTLAVISKQFNLSCVSCHVVGYQRPGGAEVVQNEGRQDVQCESCHGPGSLHAEARTPALRRATIRRQVPGNFCATECHTPEHSDHFDYAVYRPRILGPGHGYPVTATGGDAGGVSLSMPSLIGTFSPPHGEEVHVDAGAGDAGRGD